jgi:hypothetical protein
MVATGLGAELCSGRSPGDAPGARQEHPPQTAARQRLERQVWDVWQPGPGTDQGMVAVRPERNDWHRHGGQPAVVGVGHRCRHQAREAERLGVDLRSHERVVGGNYARDHSIGGMHLYYAMPEGEPSIPFRPGWLPGVDLPWMVPVPPSAKLIMQRAQPNSTEDYIYSQWASIVEPLPIAPAWLVADIRSRENPPEGPILREDVTNRRKRSQRPMSTVGARWHSEALSSLREPIRRRELTHRDQIESAIREWGDRDSAELPNHLRNPQNEHEFADAMAVGLHAQYPEVTPIYDEVGNLTGWRRLTFRVPNF